MRLAVFLALSVALLVTPGASARELNAKACSKDLCLTVKCDSGTTCVCGKCVCNATNGGDEYCSNSVNGGTYSICMASARLLASKTCAR